MYPVTLPGCVATGVITASDAVRLRAGSGALHVITSTGDDYRSGDSGATWTAVGTLSQVGTASLTIDGGTLVAATREGHVASSPDGTTWTWMGSMNQLTLTALAVDTPAVSGVMEFDPRGLNVGLPSPNPARSGATMSLAFQLSSPEVITLSLLDATGRLVAALSPVAYGEGTHTAVWDRGLLHSSVYFLQLATADGPSQSRRWVVVR